MWLAVLLVSVANGTVRDLIYAAWMSERTAHQLSSTIGIGMLGVLMWAFLRRFPPLSRQDAWIIGLLWAALTVAFEFIFFHVVLGHSWTTLLADYRLDEGRVWGLVVLWIAIAPRMFFHFVRRP